MVTNSEADVLTPSVVLFEDKEVIVGKEAKRAGVLKVGRVAEMVKRDMGNPVYSRTIRGEYMPPEAIQACILRKLEGDILRAVGPDHQVVITVPAFFDEPRRRATAQAGEMAGLNVLDIVNEPTAAALAFGENLGLLTQSGDARERMTILVYDLGGGTFDVTLVDLEPGHFRTVATDGDVRLGGRDWDMRLVDHAAEAFLKEHRGEDPRQNPASLQSLLAQAEEAKHTLSARSRASFRVEHGGSAAEVSVTRELFEQITADLLERTAHTTRQLLSAAGRTWTDINRIILVGGSTRMPMVSQMLEKLSGIAPDRTVHPDEAVARGAAIYAHYLISQRGDSGPQPKFHVTNVNAHSLGIDGVDGATMRRRNVILIPRNTPLPATVTKECATMSDGQPTVIIRVLEGESPQPDDCTEIGRTLIKGLPPDLRAGAAVAVTYRYGANGRLSIEAKVAQTGNAATLELERTAALSDDRVKQWKRVLKDGDGLDAFDSLIEDTMRELREVNSTLQRPPRPIPVSSPQATAGASSAPVGTAVAKPAPLHAQPATAAGASPTFDLADVDLATPASASPARAASPAPAAIPLPAGSQATARTAPWATMRPAPLAIPVEEPVLATLVPSASQQVAATLAETPASLTAGESPRPKKRNWGLILLLFHLSAAVVGLGLGYYVLCCLRPTQYNYLNLPIVELPWTEY